MLICICMFCKTIYGQKEGGEGETHGICPAPKCLHAFTGGIMESEEPCNPSNSSSTRLEGSSSACNPTVSS